VDAQYSTDSNDTQQADEGFRAQNDTGACYLNGTQIASFPACNDQENFATPGQVNTYRLVMDTGPSSFGPAYSQYTPTQTDLTFRFQDKTSPPADMTLPSGYECNEFPVSGACEVLPVLTLDYRLAENELGASDAPVQKLNLDIAHETFDGIGSHAKITSASVQVSFDGGTVRPRRPRSPFPWRQSRHRPAPPSTPRRGTASARRMSGPLAARPGPGMSAAWRWSAPTCTAGSACAAAQPGRPVKARQRPRCLPGTAVPTCARPTTCRPPGAAGRPWPWWRPSTTRTPRLTSRSTAPPTDCPPAPPRTAASPRSTGRASRAITPRVIPSPAGPWKPPSTWTWCRRSARTVTFCWWRVIAPVTQTWPPPRTPPPVWGATEISNSYGEDESNENLQLKAAYSHPGVAITASTGDSGFTIPSFPAVLRSVIAVGGTSLQRDPGSARGWTETAWDGSGSGCSAWVAKPAWQTGVPDCPGRVTADVAADADPSPDTALAIYDTVPDFGAFEPGWLEAGGTSAASPMIAGVIALAGNPGALPTARRIYHHVGQLNDVTSGSNANNGFDCGGDNLCNAMPGYDGPTGLGTPNGAGAF
jgi:hypothetical protein